MTKQAARLWYAAGMDKQAMHALVRFGFGAGPSTTLDGEPRAWLRGQLRGPDPGLAAGVFAELPTGQAALDVTRQDAIRRRAFLAEKKGAADAPLAGFKPMARQLYADDAAAQLAFAATTAAPFRERLVWFWANHFSVSILQGDTAALVGPFLREAIRPHVTGRFADLVLAVERHPAMLFYLDNQTSIGPASRAGQRTGRGLNENLGRECMELHTVGLEAGYSQADVTNMAKLLTGWSAATTMEGGGDEVTGFKFRPFAHEPGPQRVMGQDFPEGEAGGIAALRYLATYPTAYRRIARQLATHFLSDDPSSEAVAGIAQALARSGGQLTAAYEVLIDLGMAAPPLGKVKTPFDYTVSLLRAAPTAAMAEPQRLLGLLAQLGQPLWAAPLPNGWPDQATAWADPDLLLARVDAGFTYAGDVARQAAAPAVAEAALGPFQSAATRSAIAAAGSPREALAMLFSSPEFLRR
ncbi:DUF1800 domain-containing protein [Acidisoma sp. C75]